MKVIKLLAAGIVVGAILFFAGFGVMNLFKKEPAPEVVVQEQPVPQNQASTEVTPVTPPTIQVTPSQPASVTQQAGQVSNQAQGTSNSPIKIKPLNSTGDETPADEPVQAIAFGTLTLSTVNTNDGAPVNADFLIENSDGVAIALVKDTSTTTLSLPVGDYKITVNQGPEKVVRFLGVKDDRNGSEVFELNVATLTDEAASPEIVGGATAAVVGTPSTESPDNAEPAATAAAQEKTEDSGGTEQSQATQDPPTESTSDENTSVSVADNNADSSESTEAAQPTSSSNENSSSTSTNAVGGLRLSALTKKGKRPTTVSFYVQKLNGENVENFRNVKTKQLTLPAGKYKVTAKTSKATLTKQVEVLATKGVHEIFLISDKMEVPQQATQATSTNQSSASNSAAPTNTAQEDKKEKNQKTGKLELFAQKASNNSPIKSNFYVQMPNGKMVASKIYVDSIGYKLPAGKYKVIVRATGYKDKSVTLNVRAGQTRREIFKLDVTGQSRANPTPNNASNSSAAAPTRSIRPVAPTRPAANPTPVAFGGLTVNILDAQGAELPADIVITQRDGTPMKHANNVASASFDLPPREFLIRVTHNGLTTNHQINIVAGKLAIKTISFDTARMSRQERRRERRQRRERAQ